MADWLTLPMLQAEIVQRREEGCWVDDVEARVAHSEAHLSIPPRIGSSIATVAIRSAR